MAGDDHQKKLLSLIRDFATEKSQGERRVSGLRNRIQDLQSELDGANAELQEAKRSKEITEQELKGYEFELALNEASIHALETRISTTQDEISKIGSVVDAIKNEEGASRDEFIALMFDFNKQIRKLQEEIAHSVQKEKSIEPSSNNGNKAEDKKPMLEIQRALKDLEDELAHIICQTQTEEQEYGKEQDIHNKVKQDKVDLEKQVSMLEVIVKQMKELQELTMQTTESEETCASLGEELHRKVECPSCHLDNVGALGGVLQENQGSLGTDASGSTS